MAPRLVRELAAYYKDKRNYDKAYLFYKEWLQYNPEDVPGLVACAEMQMMRGETKDALKLYEKVLTLDADNLQANIFLGNYYYLQAEQKKKTLEENYKKIVFSHPNAICPLPQRIVGRVFQRVWQSQGLFAESSPTLPVHRGREDAGQD